MIVHGKMRTAVSFCIPHTLSYEENSDPINKKAKIMMMTMTTSRL